MTAGFVIPPSLLDREASGLDLIMHARSLWGVVADAPMSIAQVKLADWLMADPVALTDLIADAGIDLGGVLAGTVPDPRQALTLYNVTGGLIRLGDWAARYSAGAAGVDQSPAFTVTGGETVFMQSFRVADFPAITIGPATLGQTAPGPLFRCDADAEGKAFVLAGLSCTWTLDRAGATAAAQALAGALGLVLVPITAVSPEGRR